MSSDIRHDHKCSKCKATYGLAWDGAEKHWCPYCLLIEVERLQGLVDAAIRLAQQSSWVRYKYNPETVAYGYYIRDKWVGATWLDVLAAEAAKEGD